MKSKFIHSILKKFTVIFSILIFLFGVKLGHAKGQSTLPTERVVVKVKGALTQAMVDQLSQYGQINNVLWKINLVDMETAESNLSTLQAKSWVKYVMQDSAIESDSLPVSDFSMAGVGF